MTHAENGTLLSFVDGELTGAQAALLEAHLEQCIPCRESLEELRSISREVSGALGLVAPAEIPVERAWARIGTLQHRPAAQPRTQPVWQFASSGFLKAAAVVLLLAGVASAAIPGSAVRRWAAALIDRVAGPGTPETVVKEPTAPIESGAEGQSATAAATVLLPIQGGQVRVSVHLADASASVVVRLVDGEGGIRTTTAEENIRFRTGPGYVDVYEVRTGVVIEIPRGLRSASVEVNGRLYWEKDGPDVRAHEPAVGGSGAEFVFPGRS